MFAKLMLLLPSLAGLETKDDSTFRQEMAGIFGPRNVVHSRMRDKGASSFTDKIVHRFHRGKESF